MYEKIQQHFMVKILPWLCLFFAHVTFAQQDSLTTPTTKSKFKKLTKAELNKMVVTPRAEFQVIKPIKKENAFKYYQGKVLRYIYIKVYSPLGYSEQDTIKQPNKWERLGNKLHATTRHHIIKNLLEIKEGSRIDTAYIQESERLLRYESFIRRAKITPIATHSPDTIDVQVAVLDSWSIYADVQGSSSNLSVKLQEYNFLGLGHRIQTLVGQELQGGQRFGVAYTLPNIYRTHISASAYYSQNYEKYYQKGIRITRPYYSIYSRWSAGAEFSEQTYKNSIMLQDSIYYQNFKEKFTDFWASVAFPFKGEKYRKSNTKLLFSTRFNRLNYQEAFSPIIDSVGYYSSGNLYLAAVGISQARYEQERYIYRHTDQEDIPVGLYAALTTGLRVGEQNKKFYLGTQARWGRYMNFGYLALRAEFGGFLSNKNLKQGALLYQIIYFSPLFEGKRWRFRQFASLDGVVGFNRMPFNNDRLWLSSLMSGFNSSQLMGTRKTVLSLQTQWYSPLSFWGFRISPFFTTQFGLIGFNNKPFLNGDFASKFGIGFYITNDFLRIGSIEFSLFYFPKIHGVGRHIIKFSELGSRAIRLPNYHFLVPDVVPYR